jgi:hypothetical protein
MTRKYYAIKNERVIPKAAIVTTVFALMIGFAAYSTGAFAHVFFDTGTAPQTEAGRILYDLIVAIPVPFAVTPLVSLFTAPRTRRCRTGLLRG